MANQVIKRTTKTSKQLNRTVVHMYMALYQSTEGGNVNVRHSLHNWYNVCSVLWALWMALPIWCTDFTLQVHNCKKIQIAALTFDSHDTSGLPLNQPRGFSLVTNCFAIYHIHTPQVHNHTLFILLWARFRYTFYFFLLRVYQLTYMYVQTYRCIMFYPIIIPYIQCVSTVETLYEGHSE